MSVWPKVKTALVFVVVVAVGHAIITLTPTTEEKQRPFIRTGEMGSTVDARSFKASAVGLRGAAFLKDKGFRHDTQGVWIIVRMRITATEKPIMIQYAVLVDGNDRVYRSTERVEQTLFFGREFQPGIPVEGEVVFEVPRDVVQQLSIRLAQRSDMRVDGMAEFSLPISNVDVWLADETPTALVKPEVVS